MVKGTIEMSDNYLEDVYVVSELAKEYGVTTSYISSILKTGIEDNSKMARKTGHMTLISKQGKEAIERYLREHKR